MRIDSFSGGYSFLSNFHPVIVSLDGWWYPTVEHAFQAAKTHDQIERGRIVSAGTPGRAKRLGKSVTLRDDWESVKVEIMADMLRQKFAPGSGLASKLLATGDAELIEGNTWNDTFWGVCNGKGLNHLGNLLMTIREELK